MRALRYLMVISLLAIPMALARPAQGQVVIGIGIGPVVGYPAPYAMAGPPVCQWGYYPFYPYACAPYGYWGSDWFNGGVFIGAGPWYQGWYGRPWGWGYGGIGYLGYTRAPTMEPSPARRCSGCWRSRSLSISGCSTMRR